MSSSHTRADTAFPGKSTSLRSGGFAGPDLILTLGCLALLTSLIIPAVSSSLEKGRITRCSDNLARINKAILSLTLDQGGQLPKASAIPAPGGWWTYKEALKPHLTGAPDTLFACPSDRGYSASDEPSVPFHRSAKHNYTSYVYNGVTLPGIPNVAGRSLESIKSPAKTLLVMEWSAHGPLSWHRSRTGIDDSPFYDGAESVVGFVDGHVAMTRFHYDGINAAYTRDPIPGYTYQFSGD